MITSKVSDPPDGTRLVPGQQVTYTLTLDNTGVTTPSAANSLDNTSDLSDDMTIDRSSLTSSNPSVGVGMANDGSYVLLQGSVPANQRVTVTYRATVKPDGQRGNNSAKNCYGDDCTTHLISPPPPPLALSKTADPPDGTQLTAGQQVTYTMTIDNSAGTTEAPVPYLIDDMSGLIDDMTASMSTLNISSPTVTVAPEAGNSRFAVTGSVPAGERVTVTYRATVKPDGQRGDNSARNCFATTHCTTHPIGTPTLTFSKSSDPPNETRLYAGNRVTYTLSLDNSTGTAAAPVTNLTDRLASRKIIDQAKGLLQSSTGMTEPEAFRWIQKTAMDLRKSMREVAEGVIAHAKNTKAVEDDED